MSSSSTITSPWPRRASRAHGSSGSTPTPRTFARWGGGTPAEQPAGALVLDPVALDALPMTDLAALVLAGELELADRLTLDRWEPDLDGVLWPVSGLR